MSYRDEVEALRARNEALERKVAELEAERPRDLVARNMELELKLAEARLAKFEKPHDAARVWVLAAFKARQLSVGVRLMIGALLTLALTLFGISLNRSYGMIAMPLWLTAVIWASTAMRCPYCNAHLTGAVKTRRRNRCETCDTLLRAQRS